MLLLAFKWQVASFAQQAALGLASSLLPRRRGKWQAWLALRSVRSLLHVRWASSQPLPGKEGEEASKRWLRYAEGRCSYIQGWLEVDLLPVLRPPGPCLLMNCFTHSTKLCRLPYLALCWSQHRGYDLQSAGICRGEASLWNSPPEPPHGVPSIPFIPYPPLHSCPGPQSRSTGVCAVLCPAPNVPS
jgi:hypothetical protein